MAGEVGFQPSKTTIDQQVGQLALKTGDVLNQWQAIITALASYTDGQLGDLGYDTDAVVKVRAIQTRAGEMIAALTGTGTITDAHDYREEMSQWWGLGLSPQSTAPFIGTV
jgi:hypothetical protein